MSTLRTYISVHVPKTGGSSLRESFREVFPQDAVIFDPADDDPGNPISKYSLDPYYPQREKLQIPQHIELIHGHFPVSRYANYNNCEFFTFLRHPVENIVSLYEFYMKNEDPGNPLRVYVRQNKLSVVDMAKLPLLKWLMSKHYFGDFDMRRFLLIGDVTTYEEDIGKLSCLMGKQLNIRYENINRYNSIDFNPGRDYFTLLSDNRICAQLRDILADDIRFYEGALSIRANLASV